MATRRARIKAVASLPVRRKNVETSQVTKPATPESIGIALETPKEENVITENQQKVETNINNVIEQSPDIKKTQSSNSPGIVKLSPVVKSIESPREVPSPLVIPKSASPKIIARTPQEVHQTAPILVDNSPIVIENLKEASVLDGIVPLQATQKEVKPLALFKNQLLTENAEILFDPIVPLPSPSKVRPKLRPVPRLFRRNSIQGSASESEDETRKALQSASSTPVPTPQRQRHDSHTPLTIPAIPNREISRVRNDSVSSVISQNTQYSQLVPGSPGREKNAKYRRSELSRRMSMLRRRQRIQNDVKRHELTMYDLIFYNPTTNPIVPDEDEAQIITENKTSQKVEPAVEELADDPPAEEHEDTAPVPQLKLGPNGEIILDEKSLVIKQTESTRKLSNSVVHETAFVNGSKGRYTRAKRTADWSDIETVRFYRALAAVGTDFSLMEPMFPGRTRRDLKTKFKKEERLNGAQIDKALRSQIQWDGDKLESVFAQERKQAAEQAAREKELIMEKRKAEKEIIKQCRESRVKLSKASKAIETFKTEEEEKPTVPTTADDVIRKVLEEKLKQKKVRLAKLQNKAQQPIITNKPVEVNPDSDYATLTLISSDKTKVHRPMPSALPKVPDNIETGSLVVLTVNDPNEPSKKILQTYISQGTGYLTPVALPPSLLSSIKGYVKTDRKSGSSTPLSRTHDSPSSVSNDSTRSSVIQVNPSPAKLPRRDSYTILPL